MDPSAVLKTSSLGCRQDECATFHRLNALQSGRYLVSFTNRTQIHLFMSKIWREGPMNVWTSASCLSEVSQRVSFSSVPPLWSSTGNGELDPCCWGEHEAGRNIDRTAMFTFLGSSRLHRSCFLRRPQVRCKFNLNWMGGIGGWDDRGGGGGGRREGCKAAFKSRVLFYLDKARFSLLLSVFEAVWLGGSPLRFNIRAHHQAYSGLTWFISEPISFSGFESVLN